MKKLGEISLAGKGYPTPRNQCWPEGMPFVSINRGMKIIQQPENITILYPVRSSIPTSADEPAVPNQSIMENRPILMPTVSISSSSPS